MNQNEKVSWERIRAKGQWHYILMRGVFGCVLYALLFFVVDYFIFHHTPKLSDVVVKIIGLPIFGVVWGLIGWKLNEHQYRKTE
jgi:hypothetical protein